MFLLMESKILTVGILSLLILNIIFIELPSPNMNRNLIKEISIISDKMSSVSHDSIRIHNNSDFINQAASNGWPGNGSKTNPYVISGYDIDACGGDYGIEIDNTSVYFVIKNCTVSNTTKNGYGIYFWGVMHGRVENNNISGNWEGIFLENSVNNTIIGNTIYGNYEGLCLGESSDNNLISDNDITQNTWDGLSIYYSTTNIIKNNTISNNSKYGVYLRGAAKITIANNTISNNWEGVFEESSSNCSFIDNTLTNNYEGMGLGASADNNFISCNHIALSTWDGISIYYSSHNRIENNTLSSNHKYGIYMNGSSNNKILNNTISMSWEGIFLHSSTHNTIVSNEILHNYEGMGLGASSDDNLILRNCITFNTWDGLSIYYSTGNILKNNTISNNNKYGIYLQSTVGCIIVKNNISNNDDYGIYINESRNTIICRNIFFYNHGSTNTFDSLHIQAYDNGINNYWNSSEGIGNYWEDWANNNDTNDQNGDGIVDWPYKIDGSADAKDYCPLKSTSETIPEFPYGLWIVILVIIILKLDFPKVLFINKNKR